MAHKMDATFDARNNLPCQEPVLGGVVVGEGETSTDFEEVGSSILSAVVAENNIDLDALLDDFLVDRLVFSES